MPGRDGTGPMGAGSMTGRGAGVCGSGVGRRSANFAGGRGCGRGFGRGAGVGCGMGFGNRFARMSPEQEKSLLEENLKAIEQELADTKNRIEEINRK